MHYRRFIPAIIRNPSLPVIGLALSALVALSLSAEPAVGATDSATTVQQASAPKIGLLENIRNRKVIRAGYGLLPPYTQEDPVTHRISGLSVDIINQIASQLDVKVEWTRFHWPTMKDDIERGEFDVVAEPVYENIARGRDFTFSQPYAYFLFLVGVVKNDDQRLKSFAQLNDEKIRVAVERGNHGEDIVKARARLANLVSLEASPGSAGAIGAVTAGRADIAIVDPKDARRYADAHPGEIKLLWETDAAIYVPAAFALRSGDVDGANFLNVAINSLRSVGTLRALAEPYHLDYAFRDLPEN